MAFVVILLEFFAEMKKMYAFIVSFLILVWFVQFIIIWRLMVAIYFTTLAV